MVSDDPSFPAFPTKALDTDGSHLGPSQPGRPPLSAPERPHGQEMALRALPEFLTHMAM